MVAPDSSTTLKKWILDQSRGSIAKTSRNPCMVCPGVTNMFTLSRDANKILILSVTQRAAKASNISWWATWVSILWDALSTPLTGTYCLVDVPLGTNILRSRGF
jgi:hypothetical protein